MSRMRGAVFQQRNCTTAGLLARRIKTPVPAGPWQPEQLCTAARRGRQGACISCKAMQHHLPLPTCCITCRRLSGSRLLQPARQRSRVVAHNACSCVGPPGLCQPCRCRQAWRAANEAPRTGPTGMRPCGRRRTHLCPSRPAPDHSSCGLPPAPWASDDRLARPRDAMLASRLVARRGQRLPALARAFQASGSEQQEPAPVPLSKLKDSFLDGTSSTYLEELEERYRSNPKSVDKSWASFFHSMGARGPRVCPQRAAAAGGGGAAAAPLLPRLIGRLWGLRLTAGVPRVGFGPFVGRWGACHARQGSRSRGAEGCRQGPGRPPPKLLGRGMPGGAPGPACCVAEEAAARLWAHAHAVAAGSLPDAAASRRRPAFDRWQRPQGSLRPRGPAVRRSARLLSIAPSRLMACSCWPLCRRQQPERLTPSPLLSAGHAASATRRTPPARRPAFPADMGVPAEAVAEAYDAWEKGEVSSPLTAAAISNQVGGGGGCWRCRGRCD